jgi:transcriptional regulator with XRE-family HTH domain
MGVSPAILLKEARKRAGLSQRALARRAGTAQSVVARIELEITDPSSGTLASLLAAAGFELTARLEPALTVHTHMLDDVKRILSLTPEERLLEVANLSRFQAAARRV